MLTVKEQYQLKRLIQISDLSIRDRAALFATVWRMGGNQRHTDWSDWAKRQ